MLVILLVLYAYASYVQRICITLFARSKPRDLLEVKATRSAIHSAAYRYLSIASLIQSGLDANGCSRTLNGSSIPCDFFFKWRWTQVWPSRSAVGRFNSQPFYWPVPNCSTAQRHDVRRERLRSVDPWKHEMSSGETYSCNLSSDKGCWRLSIIGRPLTYIDYAYFCC